MPRKPARYCRPVQCLPFGFSSFGRSMVWITSNNNVTHKLCNSRFPRNNLPSTSGKRIVNHSLHSQKRIVNHSLVDETEDSGSSDDEGFYGTVQADFEFFDPKPSDFHGVKILLQDYLDNKQWDLGGFVDVILGQTTVGTVVKIENDEDDSIYSIVTALNLGRYKDLECVVELRKFLLKACQQKDVFSKLSLYLGDRAKDVGLLVSQRVVNLPPQLLPPLYDALFDEVTWATEDEHKNADKQNGPSKSGDQTIVYIKAEDEIFHELSSWSSIFPWNTQLIRTDEDVFQEVNVLHFCKVHGGIGQMVLVFQYYYLSGSHGQGQHLSQRLPANWLGNGSRCKQNSYLSGKVALFNR